MENTSIVAAGERCDIGCRVVLWDEDNGLSFYKKGMKYLARDKTLDELQSITKLFCIHHAASYRAKTTYTGLVGRGLSCNFIIDDDNINGYATLYQSLDIKDAGYSHKPLNEEGPGVEIAYMVEATKYPNAYSELNQKNMKVQPHNVVDDIVHGVHIKAYAPTDAQVNTVIALLWGFSNLFPNVPTEFPKDENGNVLKTVAKTDKGFLGHMQVTRDKVDPLGFPFERVEAEVKLRKQCGF